MWLVVGLGNPGAKYERTRHNIGFRVVDALARRLGVAWKTGGKLGGDTATGMIGGRHKVQLLKPMEFMNRSGFAVQRTAAFHGVDAASIVVVHDEIDLPMGVLRLKSGGGHGGHNGLRSIHEQLGDSGYARLRMGVGRDPNLPPGKQGDTAGWVLGDFPSAQARVVDAMLDAGCDDLEAVVVDGITKAMNVHNGRAQLA